MSSTTIPYLRFTTISCGEGSGYQNRKWHPPSSLSLPQVPASLYSGGKRKLFLTKRQPSPWFQTGKAFSLFLMFLSMRHRGCRGLVSTIFLAYLCPLTLSFPGQEEWLHLTGSLEEKLDICSAMFCPWEQVAHREYSPFVLSFWKSYSRKKMVQ